MSPKASSKDSASKLRQEALLKLRALSKEERLFQSEQLQRRLATLLEEWNIRSLAAFWSLPTEPLISPFLTQFAEKKGNSLLLPRVEEKEMRFLICRHPKEDLLPSPLGFLQPSDRLAVAEIKPQLYLVPGLLFGARGERIGRGGGYYDRYFGSLSKKELEIPRVGIAFLSQFSTAPLPQEQHDIPVHFVLTASALTATLL